MLNAQTTEADFVALVERGVKVNRAQVKDTVGIAYPSEPGSCPGSF
jgi:hypothetical protein